MKLTSSAFPNGGQIPRKYTCQGGDVSPPFEIAGTPAGAKSLVLICEDPDVPTFIREDQLWVHWVLFNLSPNLRMIEEGRAPQGLVGRGTGGVEVYQGPCPPDREHRYYFRLYALDILLKLPRGSSKEEVESAMQGHVVAKAEYMGKYEKR